MAIVNFENLNSNSLLTISKPIGNDGLNYRADEFSLILPATP